MGIEIQLVGIECDRGLRCCYAEIDRSFHRADGSIAGLNFPLSLQLEPNAVY
jgi:hypothetical protein